MVKSRNKKKLIILVVLFFIVGGWLGILSTTPKPPSSPQTTHTPKISPADVSHRITMTGEIVCLPHKDTSGPQTLECAYGIKTENGEHYVLDTGMMSTVPTGYDTGDTIKANGIMTPIERLSTDQWMKYDVKGIFSVTDSFEKVN